jgi:hypothetical protein
LLRMTRDAMLDVGRDPRLIAPRRLGTEHSKPMAIRSNVIPAQAGIRPSVS